jgi:hypothetical protein
VVASDLIIQWSAPPACPDQAWVASRVQQLLDGTPRAELRASVEVTQHAANFSARIRLTSSEELGERVLESKRCELLADSVALVVALSAAPPATTERTSATRPRARGRDWSVAASAHASAATGLLPELALGAGAALALEGLASLRVELGGTYYAPRSLTFDQTNLGATFRLLRVGARGCRIWALGAFELGACLGAQLYRISGVGFGGTVKRSGAGFIWGPELGVFGRLRLWQRVALSLSAGGVAPVSRQRFVFSDVVGPLHRTAALTFQVFVAPEVQF